MDIKPNLTSYILQIIIVHNALILGWRVRKLDFNKYELSKNVVLATDFKLDTFIEDLTKINE